MLKSLKWIDTNCGENMSLKTHELYVWNGGKAALPKRDLIQNCGIHLQFPEHSKVDGLVVKHETEEFIEVETEECSEGQIKLKWTNLNPDEGFVVTFLSCSPKDANPKFKGGYINSKAPSHKNIYSRYGASQIKFGNLLWSLPLNGLSLRTVELFWDSLGIGLSAFLISSLFFGESHSGGTIFEGIIGVIILIWMLYSSLSWRTPVKLLRYIKSIEQKEE